MKKLFVILLLVALVPFTIGCSLFGDDDDSSTASITKLTASAVLPAVASPSIRAAGVVAASKFKNFTMTINNNVVLTAETEEEKTPGVWTVTFGKIVTTEELAAAQQGLVPVVITSAAGTTIVNTYVNTVSVTPTAPIAITVTGTTGSFTVTAVTVGGTTTPVVVSPATVAITNSTGVKPTFTAVFSSDIFGTDFTTLPSTVSFDVEVRKAGGTFIDASSTDFSYSYIATTKTLTAILTGKTLTAGQSYEVVVRSMKVSNVEKVVAKTYTFTVVAQ